MPIAAVLLDLGFPPRRVKAVPILARTASLLAHLAEERERRSASARGGRGGGGRVPPRADAESTALGRAARARRRELPRAARLPARALAFYREKLAGSTTPGGLDRIAELPLTEKARAPRDRHARTTRSARTSAPTPAEIVRIYSTSGTTGTPSYIPLTAGDLENWVTGSARSYAASGSRPGERIVSTYNAGPFVAGAALASFDRIGLCHIPVGTGNTERLLRAIELLEPEAVVLTPSYAAYLLEWAAERGVDLAASSVGACSSRASPAAASRRSARGSRRAGARASPRRWGSATSASRSGASARQQDGMHLGARGFVHPELIDPDDRRRASRWRTAPTGELVLTHLRHRAAPLLRFRTRDHVARQVEPVPVRPRPARGSAASAAPTTCSSCAASTSSRRRSARSSARSRRGSAATSSSGRGAPGVKQEPPLPVAVELARDGAAGRRRSRDAIREQLREVLVVQTRVELVPWGSLPRSEYKSRLVRALMRKLQTQGVHHITLVGADRQTSIDFWEGVLGMPFVFEQPNLDNEAESHLYFDPGDGRLITVFTNEERTPDPDADADRPGCVHHLAFAVSQATFAQAVERLDERGISHSGVKDRGFMDSIYFEDPLGLLIELASYRFEPPCGCTHADVLLEAHKLRVERGDHHIDRVHLADAIEAARQRDRATSLSRRPRTRRTPTPLRGGRPHGRQHAEHPQAERQQPDDARSSSGPPGSTSRRWTSGARRPTPEFLAKDPADLTPLLEEEGLPRGSLWESCAIMQLPLQQARPRPLLPRRSGRAGDGRQRDVLPDRHALSAARARHLPALGFPQYPGEVATSDADDELKAKAQQGRRGGARRAARGVPRRSSSTGRPFIGGDHPSIADIRWAATLEFLRAIDYDFPPGPTDYMAAMEEALGDAYSEPAADVRGYVESVRGAAVA